MPKSKKKFDWRQVFPFRRKMTDIFLRSRAQKLDWQRFPKLLSISQTAKILQVHPNTLRKWDREDRLPAVRIGARQDRRYERHRVQALWQTSHPAATANLVATIVRRQNNWFFFKQRILRPLALSAVALAVVIIVTQIRQATASQPIPSTVVFEPGRCQGWEQSANAEHVDVADAAAATSFSGKNSAHYDVNTYRLKNKSDRTLISGGLDSSVAIFSCDRFSSDAFPSNGTMTEVHLVLSMTSQAVGTEPDGFIVETSIDGKQWTARGVAPVRTEKAGRISFNLGSGLDRQAISTLRVRITPDVDITTPSVVSWLDGIQLQADVVTPAPVDQKKNSQAAQDLNKLVAFSQAAYASTETPVITVPKTETKKLFFVPVSKVEWSLTDVTVTDSHQSDFHPKFSIHDNSDGDNRTSSVHLQTAGFHAGKYTIKVQMRNSDGGEATIEKDFLWGVVALNFDRPNPRTGEAVQAGIAVLDDNGVTICDAVVEVQMTDPSGHTTTYNAKNKKLTSSSVCVDKGVTTIPDYGFQFTPEREGIYHIVLQAKTNVGKRRLEDNVFVNNASTFGLQRIDTPTRIYPPQAYPVRLAVTPAVDYYGLVTEQIPHDFIISDILPAGTQRKSTDNSKNSVIEWLVDWKAGQTYFLNYTFDAPDISPALFTTGPFTVGGSFTESPVFQESRTWQIASDAVSKVVTEIIPGAIAKDKTKLAIHSVAIAANEFESSVDHLSHSTKSIFNADEQPQIHIYKHGFTVPNDHRPKGLPGTTPLSVSSVEIVGPWDEAEPLGATVVTEDVVSVDKTIEVAHLVPNQDFHPGVYTIKTTVADEQTKKTVVDEQTFAWGVLVVNTEQSIYTPGQTAKLGMAVLDKVGKTLCQADLDVTITSPSGQVTKRSTSDGTVVRSYDCDVHSVTNTPDYSAEYPIPSETGTFQLSLTSTMKEGQERTGSDQAYTITDSFEVREEVPYVISRQDTAIRLYPVEDYTAHITVTANQKYKGTISEFLPASFGVSNISDQGEVRTSADGLHKEIQWIIDWNVGDQHTFSYTYDPPNISPRVYPLGPFAIGDFHEARPWLLAVDATRIWDGGGGATTTWSTATNWDTNATLLSGDAVVFDGSAGGSPNNNSNWDASAPASIASLTISTYTGTLTMTKTSTTITGAFSDTAGNALTLPAGALSVGGALTFTFSGAITTTSSVITMTSTSADLNSSKNLAGLTIDPSSTGTITMVTNSFTMSGLLTTAANDTLSISSGLTLTLNSTGTFTNNGTVSGAGRLTYQNTTTITTAGTLSSIVRLDAANGAMTVPARTFGGDLELDISSGSQARTFTLGTAGSQTITVTGNIYVNAEVNKVPTVSGATNAPTMNIGGIACGISGVTDGGASEVITTGAGVWTVTGTFDISACGGTFTATAANILKMTGNGSVIAKSGGSTLVNLTIDGNGNNVHIATNDLTVSTLLTIGGAADSNNDTLTIDTGRTVTLSATTGATLTINGSGTDEIDGPGRLTYRTSTAFPSGGTLGSTLVVRYDNVTNALTSTARTDYGTIEAFISGTTGRTFTLGTGTHTLAGDFLLIGTGSGVVTVNNSNNDAVNITGSLGPCTSGGGAPALTLGTATWTVSTNVDMTACGTITNTGSTVKMNGTGNLIGNSKAFNNITIDGNGDTVTVTTSDVSVATGTLTIGGAADGNDDTLSIGSGRTLTVSSALASGVNLIGSGTDTISGSGTLKITPSTTNNIFVSTGTISAPVLYSSAAASSTYIISARTYGGDVTIENSAAGTTPTYSVASGSISVGGNLLIKTSNTGTATLTAATSNNTVSVTGSVSCVTTSSGSRAITTGTGTWTVSGDTDFTNCTTITATATNTWKMDGTSNLIGNGATLYNLTIDGNANTVTVTTSDITVSNTLTIGGAADGDNDKLVISSGRTLTLSKTGTTALTINGSGTDEIDGPGTLIYKSSTQFPSGGTLAGVLILQFDLTTNSMTWTARTDYGAVTVLNTSASARTMTMTASSYTLSGDLSIQTTGNGSATLNNTAVAPTVDMAGSLSCSGAGAGAKNLTTGNQSWTVGTNVDFTNCTPTITSGNTLVMDGTGTLTSNSNTLQNFTTSGSGTITLPAGTHTIAGNLTAGTSSSFSDAAGPTVVMNGTSKTLDGGNDSLLNSTFQISGTITMQNNDFSVGNLTVDISKSLTINSGLTMSVTKNTGTSLSLSGTINGPGRLTYQNSATTFPTSGTLGAVLITRFNAVNGNMSVPARTDYGSIEIVRTIATARTVQLGTASGQTLTLSGYFDIQNSNATNTLTVDASVTNTINPTINITGDVTNSVGTGAVTMSMGSGTWTVGGNFDLTNFDTFNNNSGILAMNGTSKTLTSNSKTLFDLQITGGSVTGSGTATISDDFTLSGGSFTAPAAMTVQGDWTNSGGTFVEGTGTVTLDGAASVALNSNCSNTDTCTNENFYNLIINKTDAADANDNVTLTSNGIRLTNLLTITDGELVQGAFNVRAEGSSAVSIGASGKWSNVSTGDIKLGGSAANAGTWYLDKDGNLDGCAVGDTDDISLTSTDGSTVRTLSGAGTYTWYDVTVNYMNASVAITVNGGTNGGTNTGSFTFVSCSSSITLSGTVYQSGNEGSAFGCNTTNLALRVSVNGAAAVSGTCSAADGTFTVTGVDDPGAADIPVVIYTDSASNPSQKLTTVTLSNAGAANITGVTLIVDRVVVSQESATAITNTHLGTADTGAAGIRYSVSSGNLTVESGMELHVLTGKTFTPGGTVTTTTTGTTAGPAGDVHIGSSGTLNMAGNALLVGGDLTNAGALTVTGSQTTTMTATGTGFTITSGGSTLRNLTFNGASGGWTNSGALTLAGDWTGTNGGFTQTNSTTITVNGSAFSLANGFTWTKASSGANLILDNATNLDFTDSNTTKQDMGAIQIGASPGVTTLKTDMSATTVTIPTGDTFNTKGYEVTTSGAFDCQGTCTLNLTDGSPNNEGDGTILDIGGDFTMSSSATLTAATGKLFMNSTAGANANRTWTTGGKAYNDVELKNAGTSNDQVIISGNVDVNGTLTLTDGTIKADTNNPTTNTAGDVSIASAATYTKGTGAWTFDGTAAKTYTDSTATPQNIGAVTITKSNGTPANNKITLASSMTVDTMTISASNTLDLAGSGYTLKLANIGSAATVLTVTGTLTTNSNSIVQFSATNSGGTVTVPVAIYNALKISGAETYDLGGEFIQHECFDRRVDHRFRRDP